MDCIDDDGGGGDDEDADDRCVGDALVLLAMGVWGDGMRRRGDLFDAL